jgi:filamin
MCGTVNLLAAGDPIFVVVGAKEGDDTSPLPSTDDKVTAIATRLMTGIDIPDVAQVGVAENGDHVVVFDPDSSESGDFSLAVFCKGWHIPGSPFLLRYVEPSALSSVHTERKHSVADANKPINFIVPLGTRRGEVNVTVEGPFGECNVDKKYFSLEGAKDTVSLYFEPKGVGAYTINLTESQEGVAGSPFLILADFSSEEAQNCRILPEDEHLFKKRLPFKNEEGTTFRVYTQAAVEISRGPGEISVLCSGSKKATVRLTKDSDGSGVEMCEVVPSAPGDYVTSVLWKGQHICDSPFTLRYRQPRNKIVASGLNLHNQIYFIGVPYRFKLNCSDFGGGVPDISCNPSDACDIRVVPVEDSIYKCELLPSIPGTHSLNVKFRGKEISGSPFQVTFRGSCNPAACKIVQGSSTYTVGGVLKLKVSTAGAGTGTLEAVAEDMNTNSFLPLTVKELSADIHQLELSPGESMGCRLSITYGKHHLSGSPFRLLFSNPNKFVAKGEGLMGARVGTWNKFTVQLKDCPPGALGVKVETSGKDKAETSITALAEDKFEVKYFPALAQQYTIKLKWGYYPIPGSPFHINCTSAVFQLRGVPKRIEAGSKLNFEVFLTSGGPLEENNSVEVSARSSKGRKLRGTTTLVEWENEQVYTCTLTPHVPGSHMVSVKWNRVNISGSPFIVRVVAMAKPENVRVYGLGVRHGEVGGDRQFTIETGAAGGGILAVKIMGPEKELKFSTRQDPRNKRTLHMKYAPTLPGRYSVEVKWAGSHVPGSPFNMDLIPELPLSQEEEGKLTIVAEVHPEFKTLGAEGRKMSLSQSSLNLGSHFEREFMSLSQDSTLSQDSPASSFHGGGGMSLSQDSRYLDTLSREVTLPGHKSCSPGLSRQNPNHISIYVEDRDSVCSNGPRKIFSYDAETQFFRRSPFSQQDSLESNTSSLYDVKQLNTRRVSDDLISIDMSDDMSFR